MLNLFLQEFHLDGLTMNQHHILGLTLSNQLHYPLGVGVRTEAHVLHAHLHLNLYIMVCNNHDNENYRLWCVIISAIENDGQCCCRQKVSLTISEKSCTKMCTDIMDIQNHLS